ncbi:uncharacterized protein LOC144649337 [Oculina patagonica]
MKCFVLLLCVCLLLVGAVSLNSVKYTSVECYFYLPWYRHYIRIPSLEGQDPRLDGNYKLRENAIEKCALVSKELGYKVFVVHDGGKCLSSSTAHESFYNSGLMSQITQCKSNGRGGYRVNHVYVIGEMKNLYSTIEYDSIGCYKHNPKMTVLEGKDPDVLDGNYTLRTDAINKCALAAMKRIYEVFAVHDGGSCLVDYTSNPKFNKYGMSEDCKSDGKGGSGASHVYVIGGTQVITSRTKYGRQLGCYKDLPVRAMESLEGKDHLLDGDYKSRKDAILKCIIVGKGRGYEVVGIQNGGMCVGSATQRGFNKYGISRDCKSDGKGGPWANEVHQFSWPIQDSLSSVKYESLGCYRDKPERSISSMEGRDIFLKDSYSQRNDSIQKCAVAAKVRGYKTFAIQDGGMCVGSPRAQETFGKYGKSQGCKNDGKGGPWANQVYNLTGTMEDILSSVYYTKLGCFNDTQARTIPSLEGQDPVLDGNYTQRQDVIRKCALAAKRRGHQVFVVMADGQCASGPNTDKNFVKFGYGKKQCSTMAVSNEVYIHGFDNVDAGLLPLVEYESVGCYKDSNERAIESVDGIPHYDFPEPYLLWRDYKKRNQAIQKCALFAKLQGYKMFAVQDGGHCRTSPTAHKTYNKYGESQDCKSDGKGGPWANQVYRFTKSEE